MELLCTFCFLASLVGDVPVEGDQRLIQLVLDGQRANIASMPCGELRTKYREWGTGRPELRLSVRTIWQDHKAFWEFAIDSDLPAEDFEKAKEYSPHYGRMLFNGEYYIKYLPRVGRVTIFSVADYREKAPDYVHIDQRPSAQWIRCLGVRPWEELLGPHPNFADDHIKKWVIKQTRNNVVSERHVSDPEQGDQISTIVASLDLSGNVIEARHTGKTYNLEAKWTWRKHPDGPVILEREWSRTQREQSTKHTELTVSDFALNPSIKPNQFEIGSLLVHDGAVVEDLIQKRRYTYAGRVIDQAALDALSEQIKSRGFSRP